MKRRGSRRSWWGVTWTVYGAMTVPTVALVMPQTRRYPTRNAKIALLQCHGPSRPNRRNKDLPLYSKSDSDNEKPTASSSRTKTVVIVGGGVGGLAVAARIASSSAREQKNARVIVLEKNDLVGGRCGSFVVSHPKGNFRHERGPSLLLLPHIYRQIFQDCTDNRSLTPEQDFGLNMVPCNPAYQVIFDDGQCVNVGFRRTQETDREDTSITPESSSSQSQSSTEYSALERDSRRILDSIEPNGAAKWDKYLDLCQAYLDCGLPNFIQQQLDLPSFPAFFRAVLQAWPLQAHSNMVDNLFDSTKLRAMATFQDLYVGLEPYQNPKLVAGGIAQSTAPAVFGLLAAIELHPTNPMCGVYAPIGGFEAVAQSLYKLAESLGVQVQCGKTVTRVTNNGVYYRTTTQSFSDSKTSDEFLQADLVVVNADLPYARQVLVKDNDGQLEKYTPAYDWKEKEEGRPLPFGFSCGVIAFHWSLDKELTDLNTHNVFLATQTREIAEQSWNVLRSNRKPTSRDFSAANFYVHRASKTDPSAAPQDCDSILVLVPCETLERIPDSDKLHRDESIKAYERQFGEDRIDEARQMILSRMSVIPSLVDLKAHILDEVVDTPATYAGQYNVAAGTPFGLSHGLAQLSLARPGAKVASMPNVVMVGASSRPGNGVPLVLIGAQQTVEVAMKVLANNND